MINNENIANSLIALNKSSMLCIQEKRYQDALSFLDKSLQIEKTLKFTREAGQTLINIANVYYYMGENQTALGKLNQAEASFSEIRDANTIFNIQNMKATIQYQLKNYIAALGHLNKCSRLKVEKEKQAMCQYQIASAYYEMKNHAAALKHVQKAIFEFSTLQNTQALKDSKVLMHKIHKLQNRLHPGN